MTPEFFERKESLDPELKLREERSERVLSLLDKLHAKEAFGGVKNREQFLEELTYEKIKRIGLLVNDTLRGRFGSEDFDGEGVSVQASRPVEPDTSWVEYFPPSEDDKDVLLSAVLEEAKKLDIRDAAELIGLGIVAVHPFLDGNGRSSRLIYVLLSEGYDGSEESHERIQEVLGERGRDVVDLSPEYLMRYVAHVLGRRANIDHKSEYPLANAFSKIGADLGRLSVDMLPLKQEIGEEQGRELTELIGGTDKLKLITFYELLKQNNMLVEPFLQQHEPEVAFGALKKWTSIEIDKVLEVLDTEQIESLLGISREVRKKSVELMIDFYAQPKKYKARGSTLKDNFSSQVRKKQP